MDTRQLRAHAEEMAKLGLPTTHVAELQAAAACIDKLRDHCRQQRREIRRLNEALARRATLDANSPCMRLTDVPRAVRSLEDAVRGWSSATALATRQLTDALQEVRAKP